MRESDKIDDLLVKVMLGEATEMESKLVADWLEQDDANRRYYVQFQTIWQESRRLMHQRKIDEDQAWERFKRSVETPKVITHPASLSRSWIRIAAAVLVVLGVALAYWLNRPTATEFLTLASLDQPLTDTLSDGSIVHLNKHSHLTYTAEFRGKPRREVELKGEAFFEVAKNPEKPFVIQVSHGTITVLGTSFNVKNTEKTTEVIVETGLVEVENTVQKMKVGPDEVAIIPSDMVPLIKKKKDDILYNYYFTGTLVCRDTPLNDIVRKFSEVYNRTIILTNEAIGAKKMNTAFDLSDPLEGHLRLISQTLEIDFYTRNDTLYLK